ncbi:MAG: Mur ligase family protein [Candidatus Krumholzibacteria bacterium]|nr:Mur ligase family protein [Candidatus Krumholzibacteria bacterium]MDH4336946.1 Mur ligase family protein [Candidatus Krumholzibacteria bacterium]MDH5269758.1 Mur ligase family protein [Candidatus Krumholzibacteria bacterium]
MTRSRRPFPDLRDPLPPALQFVLGLSPSAMTLGLGNIQALMERLGHPERAFRAVLVAGTNGKGSVTTLLESLLRARGLRTGRYTSPHVFSVAERIAIGGESATIDEMEAAAARIVPLRDEIPYSYFEALTAIAFLLFAGRGVEMAVLEVGLGGRFDATNVVDPALSIVTSISLDHRRILGDTEQEILREKLGVARPGTPLLVGDLPAALRAIVDERGAREGFPVLGPGDLGSATVVEPLFDGSWVTLRTPAADYGRVRLPFGGAHQAVNALLAVGAAEKLAAPLTGVGEALAGAFIPGRFQRVDRHGRTFVIDVAHNDAAILATAQHVAAYRRREDCALVFGLLRRKELFRAPRGLLDAFGRICLVDPGLEPGSSDVAHAPHELLASYFAPYLPNAAAAVMLWNRADERDDPLVRLLRWLDDPRTPVTTVVVMGSHRVVEEVGKRMFTADGTIGT